MPAMRQPDDFDALPDSELDEWFYDKFIVHPDDQEIASLVSREKSEKKPGYKKRLRILNDASQRRFLGSDWAEEDFRAYQVAVGKYGRESSQSIAAYEDFVGASKQVSPAIMAAPPKGDIEKERMGKLDIVLYPFLAGERAAGTTIYALRKRLGFKDIDWIERREAGETFKEITPSEAMGISTPETKLLTKRGIVSFGIDVALDPYTWVGMGVMKVGARGVQSLKIGSKAKGTEAVVGQEGVDYILRTVSLGISRKTAERKLLENIGRGHTEYLAAKKYAESSVHIAGQVLFYTRPVQVAAKKVIDVLPYAERRAGVTQMIKTAFVPFHKVARDVGEAAVSPFRTFHRRTAAETATLGKRIEDIFGKTPKTLNEEIVLGLEKGIEPASPEAKNAVIKFREIYDEAFEKQVALGMIEPEQYIDLYMHHALTKEGKKWMRGELGSGYEAGMDIATYKKKLGSAESRLLEGDVYEVNKRMRDKFGIEEFFVEDPYAAIQAFAVQDVRATRSFILHKQLTSEFGRPIEEGAPAAGRSTAKYTPEDITQQLREFDAETIRLSDENALKISKFDDTTDVILRKRDTDVLEFDVATKSLRTEKEVKEIARTKDAYDKAEQRLATARAKLDAPTAAQKRLETFDKATVRLSESARAKHLSAAERSLAKAQKGWDAKKLVSQRDIDIAETQMLTAKGKAEEARELRESFETYRPTLLDRVIGESMDKYSRRLRGKESASATRARTAEAKYLKLEDIGVGGVKPGSYWEKYELEYLGEISAAKYDVEHLPVMAEWYATRTTLREDLVKKLDVVEAADRKKILEEIEKLDAISNTAHEAYVGLPGLVKWDIDRAVRREDYVAGVVERAGVKLEARSVARVLLEQRIGKADIDRLSKRGKLEERLADVDISAPPAIVRIDGMEHTLFTHGGDQVYLPTVLTEELKRTKPATGWWAETYDPALGALKKTWISVWPGFYSRNVYGGVGWQNILAGVEPEDYARNIDVLFGDPSKMYDIPLYGKVSGGDLKQIMEDRNVYGQTGFVGEPTSYIPGVGPLSAAYKKYPEKAMHLTEDQLRGSVFMHYMYKTGNVDFAEEMVYKYHFEYIPGAHTSWEEQVLARIDPFYKWKVGNIPLQAEMAVRQPGKYAALARAREMGTTPDEYNLQTDWQKGSLSYVHNGVIVKVDLPITDLPGMYGREEAYFGLTPFLKWGMKMLEGRDEYGRKMDPLSTWSGVQQHAAMTSTMFAGRYVYAYREMQKTLSGERPLSYTAAHQLLGVGIYELSEGFDQIEAAYKVAKYTAPTPTDREKALAWATQGKVPGAQVFALPLPEEELDARWSAVGTMLIQSNGQEVKRTIEKMSDTGVHGLYRLRGFGTLVSLTAEEREITKGFMPTADQLQLLEEISDIGVTEKGATARDLYLEMYREYYAKYSSRLYHREAFTDAERMAAVARRPARLGGLRFKEIRFADGTKAGMLALTEEEYEEFGRFEMSEAQKQWMFREGHVLPEEGYERYMEWQEGLTKSQYESASRRGMLIHAKMAPADQYKIWSNEHDAEQATQEEWRKEYAELRADPFGTSISRKGVSATVMMARAGATIVWRQGRMKELETFMGVGVDR